MKFYILLVQRCEQNWYAHRTIVVVNFFLASVKILPTLKKNNTICPIYKNAHILRTVWARPIIFCMKLDVKGTNQEKCFGYLKLSKRNPTSPTNQPDKKMKKWHNFWTSHPIWMKFCYKVIERHWHQWCKNELGGRIFFQTAEPTKNGTYREFLKIDEISNFFNETSLHKLDEQ